MVYAFPPLYLSSALCLHKDPIPLDLTQFEDFYVEGDELDVTCSNNNVAPYLGNTVWTDFMDNPVGMGGSLRFTANRTQAGIYTCNVELLDPSAMVAIPPRFFTLVVHCKLCSKCFALHTLYRYHNFFDLIGLSSKFIQTSHVM